jgi:Fur family zinc uptake transcriptional regulator
VTARAPDNARPPTRQPFTLAAAPHDHGACVDAALARAEALCAERHVRLTALRRRVLELVWRSHGPRGAYDILRDLSAQGRSAAPLTVYRALEFLVAQGLVHRLESLNAFIGCPAPDGRHAGQFLVCERCGSVAEINDPAAAAAIEAAVRAQGFEPAAQIVEIRGVCPRCRG